MNAVVAKVLGIDLELGNVLYTPGQQWSRPGQASELLLGRIPGVPQRRSTYGTSIERGRRFLPGCGGSAYIDSDHLEINTAEHLPASDHAAHLHAGLRIARHAQLAANADLPSGTRLCVLANNCDGHVSYGRHTNVLTTSACFEDILTRKPYVGGFLASHLVSSVIYTGQGMVGAANGQANCDYQLSQRADWFERFVALDTMQRRPLLNLRDEPHAANGLARLHIIYYDTVLAPIANWLLAGTTQLVVAMCEAGWADPTLQFDDPVAAASRISRDLMLTEKLPTTVRGKSVTAVELQMELAQRAGEFVGSVAVDEAIPGAAEIVRLWQCTLRLLQERDVEALAGRCDNWLKYLLLERHRCRRGVSWQSEQMKLLDLQFGSLDPSEGLFFQMVQAGVIEDMPTDEQIDRFVMEPPDETRAFLRAHILRRFGNHINQMDWSWIKFSVPGSGGWWSSATLTLPDPRRHSRADCKAALEQCRTLVDLVNAFTFSANPSQAAGYSSLDDMQIVPTSITRYPGGT